MALLFSACLVASLAHALMLHWLSRSWRAEIIRDRADALREARDQTEELQAIRKALERE